MKYDDKIQLLIIGNSSVGKTSLLVRYTTNNFNSNHIATLGIDYYTKDEKIIDKFIRVKIWDTAGQERYKSLAYSFFRNAHGLILVYDVSNRESFEDLKSWINNIQSNLMNNEVNIIKMIVGNKIDLERVVMKEEGEKFAQENNYFYYESSAKDNINVEESFRLIVNKIAETKISTNSVLKDNIKLEKNNKKQTVCLGCCK
jgi:Ras-related protein Rab-18